MQKCLLALAALFITYFSYSQSGTLVAFGTSGGAHGGGIVFQYALGDTGITTYASLDTLCRPGTSTLTQGGDGKFYGFTEFGGANNKGSLISYDFTTNTVSTVVSFDSATSGQNPVGPLVLGNDFKLYGASLGGAAHGEGVFCSYNPGGQFTPVYGMPYQMPLGTGFIQSQDGYLYGATTTGGAFHYGLLCRYDLSTGEFDTVQPLSYQLSGGLLEDGIDTFYTMCAYAGSTNGPAVIQFSRSGNASVVSTMTDRYDDVTGTTLIKATDGQLYGISGSTPYSVGHFFSCNPVTGVYRSIAPMSNFQVGREPMQASNGLIYGIIGAVAQAPNGGIFAYNPVTDSFSIVAKFYTYEQAFGYGRLTEYRTINGIKQISAGAFGLYPNPANQVFNIKCSQAGNYNATITDLLGNKIKSFALNSLLTACDLTGVAAGVYLVQVTDNNKSEAVSTLKLVKE